MVKEGEPGVKKLFSFLKDNGQSLGGLDPDVFRSMVTDADESGLKVRIGEVIPGGESDLVRETWLNFSEGPNDSVRVDIDLSFHSTDWECMVHQGISCEDLRSMMTFTNNDGSVLLILYFAGGTVRIDKTGATQVQIVG